LSQTDADSNNRIVNLSGNQFGDDRTLCFAQLLPTTPTIRVNRAEKFITTAATTSLSRLLPTSLLCGPTSFVCYKSFASRSRHAVERMRRQTFFSPPEHFYVRHYPRHSVDHREVQLAKTPRKE
jgi:hypothetical protein